MPSDDVLNEGLELAMAFGEHWLRPIQARLRERHPELSEAELDACNEFCQRVMREGNVAVPAFWHQAGGNERRAFERWSAELTRRYPWLSPTTAKHLFEQGRYYAWKDGEI